jgi:hypothetical protein
MRQAIAADRCAAGVGSGTGDARGVAAEGGGAGLGEWEPFGVVTNAQTNSAASPAPPHITAAGTDLVPPGGAAGVPWRACRS